ncbi:hypothetical protein [Croceimicrobium hydrocarbonivorans]|uniref:Phospholipase/carboxylesterase/thioesterase domain-containing protein n=1 Tax=Croceimicrobium hydrocarbonivorans TaxID=2761580 RepID=A0A7H0VHH5_9FLAO|nr:hypothetical protein [Croceimicrobium hydrocarbonivorans]QNR25173.1 hypothetical protein H4K34_04860 [Croceimicrobium hydrocarbonivorans]
MRTSLLILSFLLSYNSFGQNQLKPELKTIGNNSFFEISNDSNSKLLVFLHGGLNNPYFRRSADSIDFDYLIEANTEFVNQSVINGFDLIVAISKDSLNWLQNPKTSLKILKEILNQSGKENREIYIAGFSDGGTGSFKMFYSDPDYFAGLIVFNGYPQHKNFNKTVNYQSIENKKILFFSTYKDKVIPYEFLIDAYCAQKKSNSNTFIYLASGDHSFSSYDRDDLKEVFEILLDQNSNTEKIPIQGFIKNDKVITLYPFRKKILRQFGFGKELYEANRKQEKN